MSSSLPGYYKYYNYNALFFIIFIIFTPSYNFKALSDRPCPMSLPTLPCPVLPCPLLGLIGYGTPLDGLFEALLGLAQGMLSSGRLGPIAVHSQVNHN